MTDALGNEAAADTAFAIPSLANLRDIGGCASSYGGVVRTGVVYRSTDLSRVTETDLDTLTALHIANVFDLRTAAEQELRPDKLPAHARHFALDVLADRNNGSIAAALPDIVADPALAAQAFGDGRAVEYLRGSYRDFVTLPSALASYRAVAEGIARGDRSRAGPLQRGEGPDGVGRSVPAPVRRRRRGRGVRRLPAYQRHAAACFRHDVRPLRRTRRSTRTSSFRFSVCGASTSKPQSTRR